MYICYSLFLLCLVFLVHVDSVSLLPHIGLTWNFRVRKNVNIDSLIHDLREYRFNLPSSDVSPVDHSQESENSRRESLKKFLLDQQSLFLKELVVPCLKTIKSKYTAPKQSQDQTPSSKSSRVWEYRVSDGFNKLKCSVLFEVPEGTVLMRPSNSKCEFISLPVLNTLFRTRSNIIRILYPKHDIKDLNELYKYASFETLLITQLCSSDRFRRLLVTLSVIYGIKLSKEVILDLFFYLIRSKIFWNRTLHSYWSRSLSVPVPLLLMTANKILDNFIGLVSSLDERLKESLVAFEGSMLNRDLRRRFQAAYVRDVEGNVRVHDNYFE